MQITQHCNILQVVIRGMLELALGIPAAAPDVIRAEGPMGVQPMGEGG